MSRWTKILVVSGLVLATSLAGAATGALTVKDIMGKLNKGPNALTITLKRALQKDNPDWADIQEQAKEYAELAGALGKAEPPMGDKASWDKLTKDYADTARAMNEAVQKKNQQGALAAHNKLTKACTACHRVHRQ
jgi:hypothetical protein